MIESAQAAILYNEFEIKTFKITATTPRGQWVHLPGKYLPACRITHTGVLSVCSPRAARRSKSFLRGGKAYKKKVTRIHIFLFIFKIEQVQICK